MKCQRCAKPVAYQITDLLDDGGFEDHALCVECAKKFFFASPVGLLTKPKKAAPDDLGEPAETPIGDKACPECGMKFVEFRNGGRLGCPHDYDAFKDDIVPLLESVHSATKHDGKQPKQRSRGPTGLSELAGLRRKLQKAIDNEKYEEAAKLRDRIRTLESPS
jgi:protein arginine kinase activator